MTQPKEWKVSFHDDFDPEFDAFSSDVQDELLAVADAVKKLGPAADRPHVGTLENPKHPKERQEKEIGDRHGQKFRRRHQEPAG